MSNYRNRFTEKNREEVLAVAVGSPRKRALAEARTLLERSTQTGTRTQDQLVKSQLLYQLSYLRFGWIFALQACWRAWRAAKYGSRGCWQDIFLQ